MKAINLSVISFLNEFGVIAIVSTNLMVSIIVI